MNFRLSTRATLFFAVLATILAAGLFFGTPRSARTTSSSATPVAVAPIGPPSTEPVAATVEPDATDEDSNKLLPELLRQIVVSARAKGQIWWAEGIEIAFTHGFTAAVDHLRQFAPAEQLDEKTANLLSLVARERLEFLGEGLPLIHEANRRSGVASSIIHAWARKDPLKLASYATEHLSGDHKNDAFQSAIETLGNAARFGDAQTVLNQMPASEVRTRTIESLAQRWGSHDIDGGVAWARQLASAGDRLKAERALISGASYQGASVERLQELAARYATEETRITWDLVIGGKLMATDIAAAAAWAETLPPASRDRVRQRIAAKIAQTDLAQGTALALRIEGTSARTAAIDQIHRELWQKDMHATTAWVWTLPNEFQHRVVVSIVTRWYRADESAAAAWVESLPASRVRDRATMWLAWEVQRTDPSAAAEVASRIADPEFRKIAFEELRRQAR